MARESDLIVILDGEIEVFPPGAAASRETLVGAVTLSSW